MASLCLHALLTAAVLWMLSIEPAVADQTPLPEVQADLIFMVSTGPGGGGGGNPNAAPPTELSIPKTTPPPPTPVTPVAVPVVPPPPIPQMNVPVITNAADILRASGVSSVAAPAPYGGGGRGRGIGLGDGVGLGPGEVAGTGDKVYRPGSGVVNPDPVRRVPPNYTSDAMRAKVQGEVLIECVVLPTGKIDPSSIRIIKSLDRVNGLDAAAVEAAKKWIFTPGTVAGKPVAVQIQLALEFRLH